MYTRMLIPLDGSKVAEQVLPYARFLAKTLAMPVDLLGVVDPEAFVAFSNPAQGRHVDVLVAETMSRTALYLEAAAWSFSAGQVKCSTGKGKAEEVVIEKAAADKNTLIVMRRCFTYSHRFSRRVWPNSIYSRPCTSCFTVR